MRGCMNAFGGSEYLARRWARSRVHLVQGLDSDKASMLYRPYVFVYRWVRCVRADEWKVFRLRPRLSAEQQGRTE